MDKIITKIYKLIKETNDLITLEESIKHLMNSTFTELVSDIFTQLNQPIKEKAQKEKHSVVRDDPRTIYFSFGAITYHRTLFKNKCLNKFFNPLDKWLGIRESSRYSPLVEVKAAELGSENDYREAARILSEWTPITMTHTTVGKMVKRVGQA